MYEFLLHTDLLQKIHYAGRAYAVYPRKFLTPIKSPFSPLIYKTYSQDD